MIINKRVLISMFLGIIIIILGIIIFSSPSKQTDNQPIDNNNETVITGEIEKQIRKNSKESSFFVEYRIERERVRGKQIELLRDIINDQSQEKRAKEAASMRLVAITEDIEKEVKAEHFIKAKGFKDCVVIIMPETTTVVVESNALRVDKEEELVKLVSNATGYTEEKICVIVHEPS